MKIESPVETLKYRYRLKNGRETVTTKDRLDYVKRLRRFCEQLGQGYTEMYAGCRWNVGLTNDGDKVP